MRPTSKGVSSVGFYTLHTLNISREDYSTGRFQLATGVSELVVVEEDDDDFAFISGDLLG